MKHSTKQKQQQQQQQQGEEDEQSESKSNETDSRSRVKRKNATSRTKSKTKNPNINASTDASTTSSTMSGTKRKQSPPPTKSKTTKSTTTTTAAATTTKSTTQTPSSSSLSPSTTAAAATAAAAATTTAASIEDYDPLFRSLQLLDSILQFLTRATGQSLVPVTTVLKTIPSKNNNNNNNSNNNNNNTNNTNSNSNCIVPWEHLEILLECEILQLVPQQQRQQQQQQQKDDDDSNNENNNENAEHSSLQASFLQQLQSVWTMNNNNNNNNNNNTSSITILQIGFPMPDERRLSGSTKAAAKRRMAYLKRQLKQIIKNDSKNQNKNNQTSNDEDSENPTLLTQKQSTCTEIDDTTTNFTQQGTRAKKDWTLPSSSSSIMLGKHGNKNNNNIGDDANNDKKNNSDDDDGDDDDDDLYYEEPVLEMERDAKQALGDLLNLSWSKKRTESIKGQALVESNIPTNIIPKQASYAGSNSAQEADYVPNEIIEQWKQEGLLHPRLFDLLPKRLYRHQATAIESALRKQLPTLVCTGTGSGKSICFLLPVLQAAIQQQQQQQQQEEEENNNNNSNNNDHNKDGKVSILIFPTKALAQDQVTKLQTWLQQHGLDDVIRPATLDGDTPHAQRELICTQSNIILTNPDTLHAAILPNWNTKNSSYYRSIFERLQYVVLDEAHMYQGVFGAHVAMVLARLYRIACCCQSRIVFLACSATLPHPEHHFRLLCCIPQDQPVTIVTKDSSPRAAKHFFVWNPPLLDGNGKSIGRIQPPKKRNSKTDQPMFGNKHSSASGPATQKNQNNQQQSPSKLAFPSHNHDGPIDLSNINGDDDYEKKKQYYTAPANSKNKTYSKIWYRRHSADETALLLARAVTQGVRCIAFCKTRGLVEWVYERTISALKQSPHTAKLISKVESYRGGYTKTERRQIEKRLFQNELLGVVGTSALELGVDIGGVDLTLHCGFPSSHASLLQQAGRAGRGVLACRRPSLAICICFNSPLDQHLWRHPGSLLKRGLSAPLSMPIYSGLVQGHLLCAGQEFPLTGSINPALIQRTESDVPFDDENGLLSDEDLFGSKAIYEESMETLLSLGSFMEESIPIVDGSSGGNNNNNNNSKKKIRKVTIYKTHPSIKNPWTDVSIRSIEPVSYDIVDTSHPMQGGRMDVIQHASAVMDTIPYSRIFYHAFPGAIITHRGRRYKIASMTRPPAFCSAVRGFRSSSMKLGAFAKPCSDRYFTRPLSNLKITVVKQMERVDLFSSTSSSLSSTALTLPPQRKSRLQRALDAAATNSKHSSFAQRQDTSTPSSSSNTSNDRDTENSSSNPKTTTAAAAKSKQQKQQQEISNNVPDISKVYTDDNDVAAGSFAGCGIVNVKRNVHGYKKLSMVTREEFARSELSLPDMEYDSFGFWLDCDAANLRNFMSSDDDLGHGIHALSHAILAVAPIFVPCVMNDVQCDHSVYKPTRITIFDARAGGSGICAQLWKFVFIPNGIIEAAMDLLDACPSCSIDSGYEGGCPACIQAGECIKFNDFLCKSTGLIIAKHLLKRLKQTELYKKNAKKVEEEKEEAEKAQQQQQQQQCNNNKLGPPQNANKKVEAKMTTDAKMTANNNDDNDVNEENINNDDCDDKDKDQFSTPPRKVARTTNLTSNIGGDGGDSSNENKETAREKAMKKAKDIHSARKRSVVVGRPSWPMDRSVGSGRQESPD